MKSIVDFRTYQELSYINYDLHVLLEDIEQLDYVKHQLTLNPKDREFKINCFLRRKSNI